MFGQFPRYTCIRKQEIHSRKNLAGIAEALLQQLLQLSKSSQAKKWGAYFSAVCGWNSVPISATEAYGHRVCNRLLVFWFTRYFCFAPHMHTASARTWAFPKGFVQKQVEWISHQTNPIDLLLNKSFWKCPCPRGCCVHVWGKAKIPGG